MTTEWPSWDELQAEAPPGSTWRIWSETGASGTANFLTPERVAAAASLVRTGRVIGLDYAINAFDPFPSGLRHAAQHHVFENNPYHRDDYLDSFYLQSTSQVDALRHIGDPRTGFYGGRSPEQNDADPEALGIQVWGSTGLAGRGVLVDAGRYFAAQGRPLDLELSTSITADDLDAILEWEGVRLRGGELLILRTGWAENYLAMTPEYRAEFNRRNASPGLAQREETLRWLWEHEIAMVAADNPGVEADPIVTTEFRDPDQPPPARGFDHNGMLHRPLISLMGMIVGEYWKLDELGADCAADGVYEFLLTCKPLNLRGGAGSPPNAMAIK